MSLPAEIQGERLHVISLMTRLPENSSGPLALLNVYAAGTDMVTKLSVVRFDIDLYYMADEHEALGMGLQCPELAFRQKTTLRAPRWPSSRASAPHKKDQSSSAADWRSPKSGDQGDDGRPGYPKRSRRPSPIAIEYVFQSTAAWRHSVVCYQIEMCEQGLEEHCFRGGWVSQFFRSSKSGSVVARDLSAKSHWLVLCRFHSPETTKKTSPATSRVSFARLFLWFFYAARNVGRCGSKSPAEFGVCSVKPVTGLETGSSRLQRSFERRPQDHQRWSTRKQRWSLYSLKTTSGGRLVSSADV